MRRLGAALLALAALTACVAQEPPPPTPAEPPPRAWSANSLSDLRIAAEAAPAHGLRPEGAAIATLERLEPLSTHDAEAARALDQTADALFEHLALTFAMGATDPATADAAWAIPRALAPDLTALREALAAGASPSNVLAALLPSSPEYAALVAELARARAEPESANRERRIRALRATLERWRWLPRTLPPQRIDVLVPFFELRVRGGERPSPPHAIIAGAQSTQTPTFSAAIQTITLNPTWTPPSSIVNGELLPRFRRNPGAAAQEGFEVLDRSGAVIDPASVDWRARPFPYTLRQRAGSGNALGRIRFDMPNSYAIYLHDTPSRGLFARTNRALSHGCIRVENPVGLAEEALADPLWDEAALSAAIEGGGTQTLPLSAPLPIYVLYMTAATDSDGAVRIADDVYRRDGPVLDALDRARPATHAAQGGLGGCI